MTKCLFGGLFFEGHISKANAIYPRAKKDNQALVIFQGPNTYISPSWYKEKQKTGKVVPTWNYVAIHCHGAVEIIESSEWILEHLNKLTEHNESNREKPWQVSDAPKEFIDGLESHIVGIKIRINHIDASWKMNQHHSKENKLRVIKGLSASPQSHDQEVAKVMKKVERSKKS